MTQNNRPPHSVAMIKSFFVNLSLITIKFTTGFLFGSTALIADAVHSTSDLLTDTFVILGIKHSTKPPDEEHPLGHGKFEYVLSIFLGFLITFMAYQIIVNVIMSFNDTNTIPNPLSLLVVVFVVITKFILSKYLLARGKTLDSSILIASGKESLTDVISSLVVFIGIIIALIGGATDIHIFTYGDSIAGIIVALLIVKIAIEIIYDNVQSLLGKSASLKLINATRAIILNVDGVITVDELEIIVYGHYYQALVEIRVDGTISVTEGHDIATEVKNAIKTNKKITHVTVHVNPEE